MFKSGHIGKMLSISHLVVLFLLETSNIQFPIYKQFMTIFANSHYLHIRLHPFEIDNSTYPNAVFICVPFTPNLLCEVYP